MTLKRNILRVGNRVSFGLFSNNASSMMLFYICFITIFLPQLIFASSKNLNVNIDDANLKIVDSDYYQDGTVLLRLSKLNGNCYEKSLWFNIISPDGTSNPIKVDNHSIPIDDFCLQKPSSLKKRHDACEGSGSASEECCTKYPDDCTDKPTAADNCQTNPVPECENFCKKNPNECNAAKTKLPATNGPTNAPKNTPTNVPASGQPVKATSVPGATGVKTPAPKATAIPTTVPKGCDTNPYGPGCNVNCDSNQSQVPSGCANIPKCAETPGQPGCNGGLLDCGVYPSSPQCACEYNPYALNCGNVPDCKQNPTPACSKVPDCATTPNQSGCTGNKFDCTMYPRSPDCDVCTVNPSAPGCIMKDNVDVYAVTSGFILVTYYCSQSTSNNVCGSVIDWNGYEVSKVAFEESCSNGWFVKNTCENGFAYVCYKSTDKQVFWSTYGISRKDGSVTMISSRTLPDTVDVFNHDDSNVFATEDCGYGVVTSPLSSMNTTFIQKVSTNGVKGPYTIFTSTSTTSGDIHIYTCTIAYQSSGYSCFISQENQYYNVDFLSNGQSKNNAIDTSFATGKISEVKPLNYGGYVIITSDNGTGKKHGYVIANNGTYYMPWGLPDEYTYSDVLVLPNDTIAAIPTNIPGNNQPVTTIVTTDDVSNFATTEGGYKGPGGYGSSGILSTIPAIGSTIDTSEQQFTITYAIPIIPSTGNFSIYQVNGTNGILKERVSATNDDFVRFSGSVVTLTVLKSSVNMNGASYYATVDNDFVKQQDNGQNIIGVRPNIWTFTTNPIAAAGATGGGPDAAIVRLTPEGTKYYLDLGHNDKSKFERDMTNDLSKAIPVDSNRLSTHGYQLDGNTEKDQAILRVDIAAPKTPQQESSEKVVDDISDMIKNKNVNYLQDGDSTNYLDAANGAPPTEKLWPKYWWILLLALLLLGALIGLFLLARAKNPNGRNFLAIAYFALIPIDLLLDIIFISIHGKDYKWLLPATTVFLLVPLIPNIIMTRKILEGEKNQKRFQNWRSEHPVIATTFTAASVIDTDALQEVSSRAGKLPQLSAPFSNDGEKKILFTSGAVAFAEDLPQLITYSIYYNYHVKPAMTPVLVLSTSVMVFTLKMFAMIFYSTIYKTNNGSQSDREKLDDEDDTNDSVSDEERPTPFAPESTDMAKLPPKEGERDANLPIDEIANVPTGEKRAEKPTESTSTSPSSPSAPTSDKDGKKPKIPNLFNIGNKKPKKPKENEDDKETDREVTTPQSPQSPKSPKSPQSPESPQSPRDVEIPKDEKETTPRPNVPERDSVIRESTVEAYREYMKRVEGLGDLGGDSAGASNSTVLGPAGYTSYGGYGGYYNVGSSKETTETKETTTTTTPTVTATSSAINKDKLVGAAIAGVTVADGVMTTTRYIIIGSDENEKEEEKTIITTTTTTKSDDGKGYVTKTSSGQVYITTIIETAEEKYVTQSTTGGEKYTTIKEGDRYITRTISGEEYITSITVTTISTSTSTSTSTTTTRGDGREYMTRSKSKSGGYVITKVSEEIIETEEIIVEEIVEEVEEDEEGDETTRTAGDETTTTTTTTTTYVVEDGKEIPTGDTTTTTHVTRDVGEIPTSEGGERTTTTTTYTVGEGGERIILEDTGKDITTTTSSTRKPTRKETKQFTDKNGITTITTTETIIENGKTTTTITTVKKNSSGKEIDRKVESYETDFVEEPEEEEYIVREGGEGTTIITSGGENVTTSTTSTIGTPTRKETKTYSETGVDGIETVTTEDITIDEHGKTTKIITKVKKDSSGKEISTDTETIESFAPTTSSSSKKFGGSSIIGKSIFEEGQERKRKEQAEKHTKSTAPSSSTKSIKRTSSYGRSGGKISRNKSSAKATTSSKVNRSGNKDRLGRVDSNSSLSSLNSNSSTNSNGKND